MNVDISPGRAKRVFNYYRRTDINATMISVTKDDREIHDMLRTNFPQAVVDVVPGIAGVVVRKFDTRKKSPIQKAT